MAELIIAFVLVVIFIIAISGKSDCAVDYYDSDMDILVEEDLLDEGDFDAD